MTSMILKLDLDMVKMYHHTEHEVSMSRHSKVIAQRDRQTCTSVVDPGVPPAHAPIPNPILSFLHMFLPKSDHIGGWRPQMGRGAPPPNGKSWVRSCTHNMKHYLPAYAGGKNMQRNIYHWGHPM